MRPFDAQTALEAGIVSRIYGDDALQDAALKLSQKLAAKPRGALRASKQLLRRASESVEDRMKAEMKVFAEQIQSPASVEIMTAFMERRKPDPAKNRLSARTLELQILACGVCTTTPINSDADVIL